MKNRHRWRVPRHSSCIPVWLLVAATLLPADLQAQRRDRDSWQRVPDVLAALAIGEGSQVADVGAGSGYFTAHLARAVGDGGRVYAVDISERALSQLRRLVENQGFQNVEVIQGEIDDPKLPERSLDAVLVVDAYHEMTAYQAMLAGMFKALKPGGRLVILDHVPSDPQSSRARQTGEHELSIDLVAGELREAGFELLEQDELFAQSGRNHGQWMLVARR